MTLRKGYAWLLCAAVSLGGWGGPARAEEPPQCIDSGWYSRGGLISGTCWTCFFPMRIVGINVPVGARGNNDIPQDTAAPICVCPGRTFGIPAPGISFGLWRPSHVHELTRTPWCSPTLFGTILIDEGVVNEAGVILGRKLRGAPAGVSQANGSAAATSFYNWHWMLNPVDEALDMLTDNLCSPRGGGSDYLFFSELTPTWNNDTLALYIAPEARLFTSIYARGVCAADAVMASTTRPINNASWCLGAWSHGYPLTGTVTRNENIEAQFAAASRGLAMMHRFTIAKRTYGSKAICTDQTALFLPKQQYQLQNAWPMPQTNDATWMGAAAMRWGAWRNAPVVAEDRVIVQWTYQECCITLW
jgi:conjugal transfer pilus assembly protein TraU